MDLIELTDSRISNMNQVLTEQVNACYFVNKTALKDNSKHVLSNLICHNGSVKIDDPLKILQIFLLFFYLYEEVLFDGGRVSVCEFVWYHSKCHYFNLCHMYINAV